MRALPLLERKAALQSLSEDCHHVRYLQHVKEHGDALYRHFESIGLEGVVGKKADAPYKAGRKHVWKKVKTPAFKEIEARRPRQSDGRRPRSLHPHAADARNAGDNRALRRTRGLLPATLTRRPGE